MIEVVPEIENQKVTENEADPGNAAGSDQNHRSDDEKSADHAAEARKENRKEKCVQAEHAFFVKLIWRNLTLVFSLCICSMFRPFKLPMNHFKVYKENILQS